jgi:hypothetical protein
VASFESKPSLSNIIPLYKSTDFLNMERLGMFYIVTDCIKRRDGNADGSEVMG